MSSYWRSVPTFHSFQPSSCLSVPLMDMQLVLNLGVHWQLRFSLPSWEQCSSPVSMRAWSFRPMTSDHGRPSNVLLAIANQTSSQLLLRAFWMEVTIFSRDLSLTINKLQKMLYVFSWKKEYFSSNYDMMEGNKKNREKDEWDSISKVITQKKFRLII